jgi:2-polyprenyl-3-methyl-5-hydroxy-6-metoxy-1,4-benzoquinol methylase
MPLAQQGVQRMNTRLARGLDSETAHPDDRHSGDVKSDYHDLVRRDVFGAIPKGLGRLLDVGGGVGATAATLKKEGYVKECGVIDLVASAESDLPLDFRRTGDLEDTRFIEATAREFGPFDIILCLDVLEHLRDPWTTVRSLHAALAPSGAIVASIPNVSHYRVVVPLLFRGKWELQDAGILDRTHLRFFVKETALELMRSSGLEVDLVVPKLTSGRKNLWFDAVTFGIFARFTTLQYIIRARKPTDEAAVT